MANYQDVFERFEKKYMLNSEQYLALRQALQGKMQTDQYGRHTICNVYYDTPDFSLIRTSLQKPVYKEKLRLRGYGTVQKNSNVFIELKKKYKGIVYKRRICLPFYQAQLYLTRGIHPPEQSQILKEIDYFMQFYSPHPRCSSLTTVLPCMRPRPRACALPLTKTSVFAPLLWI